MLAKFTVCAIAAMAILLAGAAHAARGSDGLLKILFTQAISTFNPYLSSYHKDFDAASLVLEPLARHDDTGMMIAVLAADIPTVENGGVATDFKSITWTLKPDVTWSDGTSFSAHDVVFSAEYCMNEDMDCHATFNFTDVTGVEALDDHTVRIHFGVAKPFPYFPFVGAGTPILQKAQFEDCMGVRAQTCTEQNLGPIGTGPFKVDEFRADTEIILSANEHYRDPGKPAFAGVSIKAADDASAARAVLISGEADYAWDLVVEPEQLARMEVEGGKGRILPRFAVWVERLVVNLTNDDPDLGPEKRSLYLDGTNPHPFLSDPAVRRALSLAIDRQVLVEGGGFGNAGQVTCNVLPAPPAYASTANDACMAQDIGEAKRILDEAGWLPGEDGVREKDGVRLSILYQTSTSWWRQSIQMLIKEMWKDIGVETELRDVDAAVFFGGDPYSPDTHRKFYADIQMFMNGFDGVDPEVYMARWTCAEIPGSGNRWLGNNIQRFCDAEYDALAAELAVTASLDERAALARRMNDILVLNHYIIPLIWRGDVSAHASALKGVRMNPWGSELWNAADWHR